MLIFLIIILFFILFQNISNEKNISLNIIKSILCFGFVTFIITEFLSLINELNFTGFVISWIFVASILFLFILRNKSKINFLDLLNKLKTLTISEKIYLSIVTVIFLLLFYQGIIYPPNNWDSLTYHMSRIMYWLSNENLNHFPTHILRHLYQPPFAEYLMMNVNVLQGNDYFSNSIQLLFLMFTLVSLNELLKWLEINRTIRIITFLFCLSIPSVVLQATSSKNDIVCGFFVITSMLFLIKCYEKPHKINFIFLGISIGLGMLTKGTFYIFIFPALLFFILLFFISNLKQKTYNKIFIGFISVCFIIIINTGHFSRNYKVNHHILNIDNIEHKMYSNETMNVKYFMSNLFKNVGLHMGYPVTGYYERFLNNFHEKYDISIDNPELNFLGQKYNSPKKFETHEDLVPNTFHFILIFIISIFLFFYSIFKKKYRILLLISIIILQIILFVIYLKWQPWHTRIHIPLFLLSSVFIGFFLNLFKKLHVLYLTSIALLYSFWFYFAYNNTRPIITNRLYTKTIFINDSRFKKYFANQLSLYTEYTSVLNKMYEFKINKVGLELNDWEYPLLSSYYHDNLKIVAINVSNTTNKIKQDINNIDVIITNNNKGKEFYFNSKTYLNKTPENKNLWIYK